VLYACDGSCTCTCTGGQVDCSTESFLFPPPTCPGDQLVFYCSTSDTSNPPDGSTVWTVNTSSASDPGCILTHALWPSVSRVCGSFQAQASEESPEDCFISTLNGTASLPLDGVEIVCNFALGVLSVMEVGRGTITITGECYSSNPANMQQFPSAVNVCNCNSVDCMHTYRPVHITCMYM